MSSGVGYYYRIETAAEREARELERARVRLGAAERAWRRLEADFRVLEATYGVALSPTEAPSQSGEDSQAVDAHAAALETHTARERERLEQALTAQRNASLRARLADLDDEIPSAVEALADRGTAESSTTAKQDEHERDDNQTPEGYAERVARSLEALAPEIDPPDDLLRRARRLARSRGSPRDQMMMRSMQAEIGRLNDKARDRRASIAVLDELAVRAETLGPQGSAARALVVSATAEWEQGGDPDVETTRAAVEHAELLECQARAAADVRRREALVVDTFRNRGYEAIPGFETMLPDSGVLVRRDVWHDHALEVRVSEDRVALDVVRIVAVDDQRAAREADDEAERAFCADVPALASALDDAGLTQVRLDQPPAGLVPVRTRVDVADSRSQRRSAGRRSQGKERSL